MRFTGDVMMHKLKNCEKKKLRKNLPFTWIAALCNSDELRRALPYGYTHVERGHNPSTQDEARGLRLMLKDTELLIVF